jgi:hypothetical protein
MPGSLKKAVMLAISHTKDNGKLITYKRTIKLQPGDFIIFDWVTPTSAN